MFPLKQAYVRKADACRYNHHHFFGFMLMICVCGGGVVSGMGVWSQVVRWCQVTATCCWLLLQEEEQGCVCVGLQFAVWLIVAIMFQHTDQ